jgi:drug/metabolite transporter (DMT)-like permease
LAPIATVFIWSGNTIVTKMAAGVISPESISFYRWLLALLIMLPFVARQAWRDRAVFLQHWGKLALLGVLGLVIYQSLTYEAAKTTSAVNMGVIIALMPLTATLLASLLASERLTAFRLVGGITSLAGLVYLTSRGHPATLLTEGVHLGDALTLVAVFANALYGVMLRRWSIPIGLWLQLFWQVLFATIFLLPIWLMGTISPVNSANLPLILYAAIPTSLLAPYLWMVGIQKLGPSRTAMFINLLPIVVALLAFWLLGEKLQSYHAIGGALAIAGVMIGLVKTRAAQKYARSGPAWNPEEL